MNSFLLGLQILIFYLWGYSWSFIKKIVVIKKIYKLYIKKLAWTFPNLHVSFFIKKHKIKNLI